MFQVILNERHRLCCVPSYQGHLGKVIEVIEALPTTDLVGAGRNDFVNDLF
jgi:hypothetical protein